MELAGKVGIVTGASRGLGVTMAERLARAGVDLVLAARSEDDLERAKKEVERFGSRVLAVPTDVTKLTDLRNLVARTQDELGPPDLLVNNAGIENYAPFHTMEPKVIEATVKTNLVATQLLIRLVLPSMVDRRTGHIVNISSMAGKTAVPFNVVYSSTKHALVGFSWSLREEVRGYGVGVSVVCPTFVTGDGMFERWSQGKPPPSVARAVTPEAVAEAVVKAVERNKAEVTVVGGLGKIVDVIYAASPEMALGMSRRLGLFRFLRKGTEYSDFAR